jgi:acetyltransferase-like isoleucine patch superfamily enzyme
MDIKNFYRTLKNEFINLIEIPIIHYPSSKISNGIRKFYFKKVLQIGADPLILSNFDIRAKHLVKFGDSIKFNKNVSIDASGSLGIYIGNKVSIGPGSYIRSANHSFSKKDIHIQDQGWSYEVVSFEGSDYSIVIEDNVWIGANVSILSGAHIHSGSVLGAGTVVSSSIPKNSIVAGNPGKIIKTRK